MDNYIKGLGFKINLKIVEAYYTGGNIGGFLRNRLLGMQHAACSAGSKKYWCRAASKHCQHANISSICMPLRSTLHAAQSNAVELGV